MSFINLYAPWCVWCKWLLHPTWEVFEWEFDDNGMPVGVLNVDNIAQQHANFGWVSHNVWFSVKQQDGAGYPGLTVEHSCGAH
eukprot:scaffold135859_cov63-Attheya_sp.AAC.5